MENEINILYKYFSQPNAPSTILQNA